MTTDADATRVGRAAPLLPVVVTMAGLLVLFLLGAVIWGRTDRLEVGEAVRGILAAIGLGVAEGGREIIAGIRFWQALTAAGVGAALAGSGALLQGVFRNGLAAPSIIGVSAGASVGAAIAVLALGGYASGILGLGALATGDVLVAAASFVGALAPTGMVVTLASSNGRISVPTLLLAGIAINACCGGILAAIQAITLEDYDVARAIFSWTFGSLDDKAGRDAALIWGAVILSVLTWPFVAVELDLFAGGEKDARTLGVAAGRVKFIAVAAAALLAATAVSVAGQIAFVGLVVPHLVRLVFGRSHTRLLPISLFGGALFVLGAEWLQAVVLGDAALRPGVFMSLIGGPFFLGLLVAKKKELRGW